MTTATMTVTAPSPTTTITTNTTTATSTKSIISMEDAMQYMECRVRKHFGGYGWFYGVVLEIFLDDQDEICYHVHYSDGDKEDLYLSELLPVLDKSNDDKHLDDDHGETTGQYPAKKRVKLMDLWQVVNIPHNKGMEAIRSIFPSPLKVYALNIARFFIFMYERQLIWRRRKSGASEPYSQSYAMCKYFFCNNYRELDRGTKYFRAQMIQLYNSIQLQNGALDQQEWITHVLWASICYRLCNLVGTFEAFGKIPVMDECERFCSKILQVREAGIAVFTPAHIVVGFDRYMETLRAVSNNNGEMLRKVSREIYECCIIQRSLEGGYNAVRKIRHVGNFFAWQITCDLLESQCLSPCTENGWTMLGPGANKGIGTIFNDLEGFSNLDLARRLVSVQKDVYDALELKFPYVDQQPITLKNMEHVLCEFSKYNRLEDLLRSGESLAGQRLAKFRSASDKGKACACGRSNDIKLCDKCNTGYCPNCTSFSKELYWVCPACVEFESISFTTVTTNMSVTV